MPIALYFQTKSSACATRDSTMNANAELIRAPITMIVTLRFEVLVPKCSDIWPIMMPAQL